MNRPRGTAERLQLVSGGLFLLADIFAVISALAPEWIITEPRSISGATSIGLIRSCLQIAGRDATECYFSSGNLPWLISFICICTACILAFITGTMLLLSNLTDRCSATRTLVGYGRWIGHCSLVLFCMSAIVIPAGFGKVEIGGSPYQLPRNCRIGSSYIFFISALWTTVISTVLAGRFCTGVL